MSTTAAPPMRERKKVGKRKRRIATLGQLKQERSHLDPVFQLLGDFLLPWSARMFVEDHDRVGRRYGHIYDSTGSKSVKTTASGLMAIASSPAREWFAIETVDSKLNKRPAVRRWLDECQVQMRLLLSGSNTYRVYHSMYEKLLVFGTAASLQMPHTERVLWHYPVATGEFWIAQNFEGTVDTLYREFQMTVSNLVQQFGYENCSPKAQRMWDLGTQDHQYITVCHAIEPNLERDPRRSDSRDMAWSSCYYEQGPERDDDQLLSESGFKRFPCIVPRWDTDGRDVWGNSPGMLALGDVKGLQHKQVRKAEVLNKKTNPALQGPPLDEINRNPGEYNAVNSVAAEPIRPLHQVDVDYAAIVADILDQRMQIQGALYSDLFRVLMDRDYGDKTVPEIRGLEEEKLIQLGPFSERLQVDMFEPTIVNLFDRMIEGGRVPPPPAELNNAGLQVRFISILARAQRSLDTTSVDRWTLHLGTLKNLGHTNVTDKIDADKAAEHYADVLGVPKELVVAGPQLALVRKTRADAQAAIAQLQAQKLQSETMRNAAASPTGAAENALTDVMGQYTGYNRPVAAAG